MNEKDQFLVYVKIDLVDFDGPLEHNSWIGHVSKTPIFKYHHLFGYF